MNKLEAMYDIIHRIQDNFSSFCDVSVRINTDDGTQHLAIIVKQNSFVVKKQISLNEIRLSKMSEYDLIDVICEEIEKSIKERWNAYKNIIEEINNVLQKKEQICNIKI